MKDKITAILVVGLTFVVFAIWGGIKVRQHVHWNMYYEELVEAKIVEMVEPQYLKPEYRKNINE